MSPGSKGHMTTRTEIRAMQLLALKMEGAGSQVMQSAASSWERQEIDSP